MHFITKSFDFCYGHRVWTQALDADLSCNQPCKCRHLHGHQGKVTIELTAPELSNGMVTDFHHLNWFKKWLDANFDHKMILDKHDPLLHSMLSSAWPFDTEHWTHKSGDCRDGLDFYIPNLKTSPTILEPHVKEMLEGLVVVEFIPTSENLARFFFWHIQNVINRHQDTLGPDVRLQNVTFQETPKTSASYSN